MRRLRRLLAAALVAALAPGLVASRALAQGVITSTSPCLGPPENGHHRSPLIAPFDISGRYVREFPGPSYCETLHPPPSVWEIDLISSQETTDAAGNPLLHFDYKAALTTYQSVWRANCVAGDVCDGQGTARCDLHGYRYEFDATLRYVVGLAGGAVPPGTPAAAFCFETQLVSAGLAPGSVDDYYLPGTVALENGHDLPCGIAGPHIFGCNDSDIDFFGINEIPLGEVAVPPPTCLTCPASEPEIVTGVNRYTAYPAVDREPDRLDIEAIIGGKLLSNVPTDTDTGFDNVVEGASIGVFLQRGPIPAQGMQETNAQYRQRVFAQLEGERATVTLRREQDGTFAFGAPGAFETPPLSTFRLTNVAGKNVWYPAHYTLVVRGAQTEEIERDPDTNEPTGGKTSLLFADTFVTNLIPGSLAGDVELEALTGLSLKQRILDSVVEVCPIGYGPPEAAVSSYLDDVQSGTIPLTGERDEGLRRAAWSEIAVRDNARYAGQILPLAMEALGNLLAQVFDDLVKFESGRVTRGREQAKKLDASVGKIPPGYAGGFNLNPADTAARFRHDDALKRSELIGRASMAASEIKKVLKVIRVGVEQGLIRLGVDPPLAGQIASTIELGQKVILSAVESGSLGGASKPVLKQLIKDQTKGMADELLDSPLPFSYCALTSDLLVESGQTMQTWNVDDHGAYSGDRGAVTTLLAEAGRKSSDLVWTLLKVQWVGELADLSADVFKVLGKVFKPGEAVAKLAKATKYGTSAGGFVAPILYVFSELRHAADVASHAAYGQPPSGAAVAPPESVVARGTPVYPAPPPVAPSYQTALLPALSSFTSALHANDFAAVDAALWGEAPGTLRRELEVFLARARGFRLAAQGIDPVAGGALLETTLADVTSLVADFETAAQDMIDLGNDLLVDVWAVEFSGADDAAFVARRTQLVNAVSLVQVRAAALFQPMFTFSSQAGTNGVGFLPAVMVQSVVVESTATSSHLISASPETFTVEARIVNPSAGAVTGATARLTLISPKSSTTIAGSADVALGTLAANDGTPGSGGDETVAQWQIQYAGDLTHELVHLNVEILEGTAAPSSFVAGDGDRFVAVDPDLADADLDLLPDDWEAAHGLDLGADDSQADPDGDGLVNYGELIYGTLPKNPDTDGDGRSDGAEVGGGVSSVATDPHDPDTDDDGLPDGTDPAPLDPTNAGAGTSGVGASAVGGESPVGGASSVGVASLVAGASARGVPPGEPVVSLSKSQVVLTKFHPFALVHVTNSGGGVLEWGVEVEVADAAHEGIVTTDPPEGETSTGDTLLVGLRAFDFDDPGGVAVTLRVFDVSGAVLDSVSLPLVAGEACGGDGFDADANGQTTALTDGLLFLRHLFGLSGAALTAGAIGPNAARTDAAAIAAHAQCIRESHLDADGNGAETALTDGLLLLRYLFGLRGPVLLSGAVGAGCTRCDAASIEAYFADLL